MLIFNNIWIFIYANLCRGEDTPTYAVPDISAFKTGFVDEVFI